MHENNNAERVPKYKYLFFITLILAWNLISYTYLQNKKQDENNFANCNFIFLYKNVFMLKRLNIFMFLYKNIIMFLYI